MKRFILLITLIIGFATGVSACPYCYHPHHCYRHAHIHRHYYIYHAPHPYYRHPLPPPLPGSYRPTPTIPY